MKKDALKMMEELKENYKKQVKNCERKMAKYPPNVMGYKDALMIKTELEKRIPTIEYIIDVISKQ